MVSIWSPSVVARVGIATSSVGKRQDTGWTGLNRMTTMTNAAAAKEGKGRPDATVPESRSPLHSRLPRARSRHSRGAILPILLILPIPFSLPFNAGRDADSPDDARRLHRLGRHQLPCPSQPPSDDAVERSYRPEHQPREPSGVC